MTAPRAFVIDDDPDVRAAMRQTLDLADIAVDAASAADRALERIDAGYPGAIVLDMRMPRMDGFEALAAIRAIDPDIPVVMLTGHGDVPMAVKAMRAGAYDFLEKPAPASQIVETVRRACEKRALVLENRALKAQVGGGAGSGRILGASPAVARLRERLGMIARSDADVLILGETGAGKELAAQAIHEMSARSKGPFVAVNCGALPATLAESELFGHDAGAFTGAGAKRVGKFEHANRGTLFLDEIESTPLDLQVKMLRVLQEREVTPLGANRRVPLDLRVIAATKVDLLALARSGKFREDLYYRLDVARVSIPPLRERGEDAALIFEIYAAAAARRHGRALAPLGAAEAAQIAAHPWPGNVRELKNAAERYAIGLGLPFDAQAPAAPLALAERVDAYERGLIVAALRAAGGRVAEAAEALGAPRNTLYDKLRKHAVDRSEYGG